MKNKLEEKLDAEFKQMNIKLRIYHFRENVLPYTSITIVINSVTSWNRMRELLDTHIFGLLTVPLAPEALEILRKLGIYGVTICDRRDKFDRKFGRTVAKGRLLKHLQEVNK